MTKIKFCQRCRQSKPETDFPSQRYICSFCLEESRKLRGKIARLKIKTDPVRRLRLQMSKNIHAAIKFGKKFSIMDHLPYSIEELKNHLEKQFEPWMSWSNWGVYNSKTWDDNDSSTWTWQIDHIVPQVALPYSSPDDANFRKCWNLSNLRPLSAKRNILDGVTRTVRG